MKIQRLETHDRYQHFIKDQSANIFQGAEDCLKRNSLSLAIQEKSPYLYIFAHPRTDEDGVTQKMLWDPRLSIPEPQTNSYLFRAISKTDIIEVVWMLPPKELWSSYQKGKVTESNWTMWSINQFRYHKQNMDKPHPDDMPEEKQKEILKSIVDEKLQELRNRKMMNELYTKQMTLVDFPPFY